MNPSRQSEAGLALLDAMIAVFIISIGVVGAIDLIVTTQVDIDFQRKVSVAGLLAASKIEQVDALDALPTPVTSPKSFGDVDEFNMPEYNKYTYTLTTSAITAVGHSPAGTSDLTGWAAKVVVTVFFKDMRGKDFKIVTTSVKTRRA